MRSARMRICCSLSSLQKTWKFCTHLTLKEYIAKRRITLAGRDILRGETSVLDIALKYGYNSHGQYAPTSYGSDRINYGYNSHGEYVPTSVGSQKIEYGYNAHGQYVPKSIGNNRIEYGYNSHGNYAPRSYAGKTIEYGYNSHGNYVPLNLQ